VESGFKLAIGVWVTMVVVSILVLIGLITLCVCCCCKAQGRRRDEKQLAAGGGMVQPPPPVTFVTMGPTNTATGIAPGTGMPAGGYVSSSIPPTDGAYGGADMAPQYSATNAPQYSTDVKQ
jgi:hypothetical protein